MIILGQSVVFVTVVGSSALSSIHTEYSMSVRHSFDQSQWTLSVLSSDQKQFLIYLNLYSLHAAWFRSWCFYCFVIIFT